MSNMERTSDLLGDLHRQPVEPAGMGIRLINYLVDTVIVYVLTFFLMGTGVFIVVLGIDSGFSAEQYGSQERAGVVAFFLFVACFYLSRLIYYLVTEGLAACTVGKLLTGTRVYRLDGRPLTWGDAFKRSLCRLFPFEVFSGFGTPWHDDWTKTTVGRKGQ